MTIKSTGTYFELGFRATGGIRVRGLEQLILEKVVQGTHIISFWGALRVGSGIRKRA